MARKYERVFLEQLCSGCALAVSGDIEESGWPGYVEVTLFTNHYYCDENHLFGRFGRLARIWKMLRGERATWLEFYDVEHLDAFIGALTQARVALAK